MLTIKLIELNENRAVYAYFPEDKGITGKVAFDRRKKERSIIQKAEGYSNIYAFHALKRIEEYDASNNFKNDDIVAWY